MAKLTLIGEPLPGHEAHAHTAAARDLTEAVAAVAPRGCSARLLVASDSAVPTFQSSRARVEVLPMRANLLPMLWRSAATARPLDDELVHAVTPLVPLRARNSEDSTQTSVMVPHALAWEAPDLMGVAEARQFRAYAKRAMRYADAVVTPTHAVAQALVEVFGSRLPIQVVTVAAPREYLAGPTPEADAERRAELGLPERYIVTSACSEADRVGWLFDAMESDPALPDVVVMCEPVAAPAGGSGGGWRPGRSSAVSAGPQRAAVPETLASRVHVVEVGASDLSDWGVVLSGASLLALPQEHLGTGYEILGALGCYLPIVHAGNPVATELAFDAGVAADSPELFRQALSRLMHDSDEVTRLRWLATDRSRSFSWETTAWQLWELHANL